MLEATAGPPWRIGNKRGLSVTGAPGLTTLFPINKGEEANEAIFTGLVRNNHTFSIALVSLFIQES